MPVNLSIKNVPDEIADQLRDRARRNHRSLQGEIMSILEQTTKYDAPLQRRPENPEETERRLRDRQAFFEELAAFRSSMPAPPENAVESVRRMRDEDE